MNPKINADVTVTFVRAGTKNDKDYLILSNGRKEFFARMGEGITLKDFEGYNEDDQISVTIETLVGTDRVLVVAID